MSGKLDIKMMFIFVLAGLLILSFIFRPSKQIDTFEDEIELLKEENNNLISKNDSLNLANIKLNGEIDKLLVSIDSTLYLLGQTNDRINDLEYEKGKVSDYVKSLDADGVASSLTDYLERRTK